MSVCERMMAVRDSEFLGSKKVFLPTDLTLASSVIKADHQLSPSEDECRRYTFSSVSTKSKIPSKCRSIAEKCHRKPEWHGRLPIFFQYVVKGSTLSVYRNNGPRCRQHSGVTENRLYWARSFDASFEWLHDGFAWFDVFRKEVSSPNKKSTVPGQLLFGPVLYQYKLPKWLSCCPIVLVIWVEANAVIPCFVSVW